MVQIQVVKVGVETIIDLCYDMQGMGSLEALRHTLFSVKKKCSLLFEKYSFLIVHPKQK